MSSFKKILCLLLAAFMLVTVMAACTPSTPDAGGSDSKSESRSESDTPAETPVETEPPKEPLSITDGKKCQYTVVRPENAEDGVTDAAVELKDALVELTGGYVSISEDFLFGSMKPGQFEILVGQTNREESAKALEGIRYDDYIVSIEGDKLVINAYTAERLQDAVQYVIGLIKATDGNFIFAEEDQKFYKAEYKFDTIMFEDISLEGYTIIASNKSSTQMNAYAKLLQKRIIAACGIYLPIKFDVAEETDKEILIGDTNRAASKAVDISSLGQFGYTYKADGTKIVIKANENFVTFSKAIDKLSEGISAGKITASSGQIELGPDPILTSFCFSDVHNNFAMLEPPYVVRGSATRAIKTMLETEGKVDVVQVGGDLMSDYPHWDSSGWLPYEYFVEYRKLLVDTFSELAVDGKVVFCGGNHDYGQGELAKDGPGTNGSYNSSEFYFDGVGMMESMGELPEEDMYWVIGEHTGQKYLICYYYEVNGVGFAGLAPDPDIIWSVQGDGFSEESLKWLDKKLDEVDPAGNKVIFVNCHYPIDNRNSSKEWGSHHWHSSYNANKLTPVFKGHKNLFHLFGHWETWYSDYTVKNVFHYDTSGKLIEINGDETDSTQLVKYEDRGFNAVYMGHFRPMYGSHKNWFAADPVRGYGGYSDKNVQPSTATPRVGQGMFIQVYEDRVVFTMKNFGDIPGLSTDDLIEPYTVYLYK